MLLSLSVLFIGGLIFSKLASVLHLPPLTGMLLFGIAAGPYALNLFDASLLELSPVLRKIALLVLLIRAGLNLDFDDFQKAGISALLLCFVPAVFEIAGCLLLAPVLLGFDYMESLLLGCVLAAVSPAVIVPGMLNLIERKSGTDKQIPQMILAGASADDIFVIVLFSIALQLNLAGTFNAASLIQVPSAIITGILAGILWGLLLGFLLKRVSLTQTQKTILMLSASFLLAYIEDRLSGRFGFSGLVAVMVSGMMIRRNSSREAESLSKSFGSVWEAAQIMLFVLIGAAANLQAVESDFGPALLLIVLLLVFRMAGVFASLVPSRLSFKEKLFTAGAYIPKATVQAAIGAVPLAMGLACGSRILSAAVISILTTAPAGALFIDIFAQKLLRQ